MENINKKEENLDKKNHKKLFKILKIISIITIFITLLLLYSRFIATKGITVKEYNINAPTIPDSFDGLKIAHIADIHYGRTTDKNQLNELVSKLNEIKPDIVIFTGDLIDKDTKLDDKKTNEIIEALSKIEATLGKYSIKGNHDYSFDEFDRIINESSFTNISDSYELIYNKSKNPIMIIGLNSNLKSDKLIQSKIENINENIKEIDCSYKILMLHEPDYVNDIDYNSYNLILAGHSHGGQIRLPLIGSIITPTKAKIFHDEYYKLNNTNLFISSGIGTSTVSFRLFNKPSFNLYRISK